MMRRHHTAERLGNLITTWLLAVALGLVLLAGPNLDQLDAWRHRMLAAQARVDAAYTAHLQRQAERDYTAWQQARCGPETGYRQARSGAWVCTDKRGRPTGQQLAGAAP